MRADQEVVQENAAKDTGNRNQQKEIASVGLAGFVEQAGAFFMAEQVFQILDNVFLSVFQCIAERTGRISAAGSLRFPSVPDRAQGLRPSLLAG